MIDPSVHKQSIVAFEVWVHFDSLLCDCSDGGSPKSFCSLFVVSHETLEVPAEKPKSEKMLGKSQAREMVRIKLEIEQIDGSKVTDQWIDDLFDRYDSDKSGQIDDSEWESLAATLQEEVGKIGAL